MRVESFGRARFALTPLTLIRGVTKLEKTNNQVKTMTIECRIDWISAVFNDETIPLRIFPKMQWEDIPRAARGYSGSQRDKITGAIASYDNEPGAGSMLVSFGGDAISRYMETFGAGLFSDGVPLLGRCSSLGAHFTRIDIAVDFRGEGITPSLLHGEFLSGLATSPVRTDFFGTGRRDTKSRGDTFYLGARQSELFMRIYNKAAQLNLTVNWCRMETEIKGKLAQNTADAVFEYGLTEAARTVFSRMLKWENPVYARFLDGERAPIQPVPRQEPKTERWLREDVSGTWARIVRANPDFELIWNAAVQAAYDDMTSGEYKNATR